MKLSKLERFAHGSFLKNVATMMTGTVIASAIPMLVSPILTRLYSPEEYGVFAGFMLAAMTFASFASARYELAIVQAESDEDAFDIIVFCVILSVAVCVLGGAVIVVAGHSVLRVVTNTRIGSWVYLLPLMAFMNSVFQIANYGILRSQSFSVLSGARVARAVAIAVGNIGFGILHVRGGLMISSMIGQAVVTLITLVHIVRFAPKSVRAVSAASLVAIAKRHRGLAKYALPADLMSTYAGQMPLLVLDAASAGAYAFVLLVVGAPISVVSGSVLDAFKERASREYRQNGEFSAIFASVAKTLALVGIVPFVTLMIAGESIFSLIFGEQWRIAGMMSQLLAGMFFLKMIVSPLSFSYYIVEKQAEDFVLHIVVLLGAYASLRLGVQVLHDARLAIGMFSALYSVVYVVYFVRCRSFSKGRGGKRESI